MKTSVIALATSLLVASSTAFVSRANVGVHSIARGGAANLPNKDAVVSKPTALNMALDDPKAFAQGEIDSNDVMVFSKSYCPFCEATKKVLGNMDGVTPKIIELDLDENGQAIQDALIEITGQKTVPNVFVKGNHIGGNDDTQLAAKMGKIKKMLAE